MTDLLVKAKALLKALEGEPEEVFAGEIGKEIADLRRVISDTAGASWDQRYRPLIWGEVIQPTDECRRDDGAWVTGICVGEKAPDPSYTSHRIYRRLRLYDVVQEALEFACLTLAFHGRDRGTPRQEKMLDDLEVLARRLDTTCRTATKLEN